MNIKKFLIAISTALVSLSVLVAFSVAPAFAATCTPTGFSRDNINMTAALINPSGTVTGDINATGCNVGVYYDNGTGSVNGANIYGANYFGVLVNGDTNNVTVNVTDSNIHNIGEVPFNGDQHGVAIYYRSFGTGSVTGEISGNTISDYQKGGITANGNANVSVTDNTVTGLGPVPFIAQNGIQFGWGATGKAMRNTVTGNSYTGTNDASSVGILVYSGPYAGSSYTTNLIVDGNTLTGNDVGVYLGNFDAKGNLPATKTNIKVVNNVISYDALNNVSGNGDPIGYQAGISDIGNNDKLINNKISGDGYDSTLYPGQAYSIDLSYALNNAKVHANK